VVAADLPAAASLRQASEAVAALRPQSPVLFVQLDKWEAENVDAPQFVDVALDATLLAPSGKILWTTRRTAGPVATRNATDLTNAYQRAADAVARSLVDNWTADEGHEIRDRR
jgi:ABC-type uncharacterized transport system auxiliary subunit